MAETGNQMYARLVSMRDAAGEKHYERIKLADQLLKDKAWVESPSGGGGDESKAIDMLEAQAFGDLCGVIGLPQLLDIFHHVPDVKDWRKHRFDLKKIYADWKSKQKPTPKPSAPAAPRAKSVYTPPIQLADATPAKVRHEYERVYKAVETVEQKAARLETENEELRAENIRLKDEIKRLKTGARDLFKIA